MGNDDASDTKPLQTTLSVFSKLVFSRIQYHTRSRRQRLRLQDSLNYIMTPGQTIRFIASLDFARYKYFTHLELSVRILKGSVTVFSTFWLAQTTVGLILTHFYLAPPHDDSRESHEKLPHSRHLLNTPATPSHTTRLVAQHKFASAEIINSIWWI